VTSQALATPREVAAFFHTTTAKLANDRYLGIGVPFVKFNKKILYRWADVHSYVEANIRQRTDDSRPTTSTPTTKTQIAPPLRT
jgi:hypothetical protein